MELTSLPRGEMFQTAGTIHKMLVLCVNSIFVAYLINDGYNKSGLRVMLNLNTMFEICIGVLSWYKTLNGF